MIAKTEITMQDQDVRWQQRFKHFQKALLQLDKAVELSRQRPLDSRTF
jgi:hypothetical protein